MIGAITPLPICLPNLQRDNLPFHCKQEFLQIWKCVSSCVSIISLDFVRIWHLSGYDEVKMEEEELAVSLQ